MACLQTERMASLRETCWNQFLPAFQVQSHIFYSTPSPEVHPHCLKVDVKSS